MEILLGARSTCSIARSLDILGDRWILLIVREALVAGSTRFQEFRDALGIAPNVLAERLSRLVEEGIFDRHGYRVDGARERFEYVLTDAGRDLNVVIAGLADWGRRNRPMRDGTSPRYLRRSGAEDAEFADRDIDDLSVDEAVLAFVTPEGDRVNPRELIATRAPDSARR
jgi:DNA-binding HxlR family transcriptional regulator